MNARARLERECDPSELAATEDGPPVVRPATVERASELVALAAREGWRILPRGAGTRRGWLPPPERVDLVLSAQGLGEVIAYDPGDGTLAAQAGACLGALRERVSAGGHELPPALAHPKATIGGTVAAGHSGIDRLGNGPLRDALLGAGFLRSDGKLARSGGRLVKNVTGYDLHRLLCGSFGTLAFLTELDLRLRPRPELEAVVEAPASVLEFARDAAGLRNAPLRPRAVLWEGSVAGTGTSRFFLAGPAARVRFEAELLTATLAGAERLEGREARRRWAAAARFEGDEDGWAPVAWTSRPSAWVGVDTTLRKALGELDPQARVQVHPWIAQGFARGARGFGAEQSLRLAAELKGLPAHFTWRDLPPSLAREIPPLPSPSPPRAQWMRRLRRALDPTETWAPQPWLLHRPR